MNEYDKLLDTIPEDVLQEVLEAEREIMKSLEPRRKRKKPYPSSRDVAEAIAAVVRSGKVKHPDELPDKVLEYLESKGFDTRHVTVKRIWGLYEKMVKKGVIPDLLGVVVG